MCTSSPTAEDHLDNPNAARLKWPSAEKPSVRGPPAGASRVAWSNFTASVTGRVLARIVRLPIRTPVVAPVRKKRVLTKRMVG